MQIQITTGASFALERLKPEQGVIRGTVHSVYRKTVNLMFADGLVSLQCAASPVSPLSLITGLSETSFSSLPIRKGQTVLSDGSAIRICCGNADGSDCIFSLSGTSLFDPYLTEKTLSDGISDGNGPYMDSNDTMRNMCDMIYDVLSLSGTSGFRALFIPDAQSLPEVKNQFLINTAAQTKLSDCRSAFSAMDYHQSAEALAGLTGLGVGLTPSGDDFLCGVLAGLIFLGKSRHPFAFFLKQEIAKRAADTNDISRAFLECAVNARFGMAVKMLPDISDPAKILAVFSAIGHSSGMDTLCGILFVCRLFMET